MSVGLCWLHTAAHAPRPQSSTLHPACSWSQNLASVSEATVKADQAPDMPMEEMQKFSVNFISQVGGSGGGQRWGAREGVLC